jgi:S1-C subfamily serine protease
LALAGSYTATGFIVDVKRGILLTNRHVVSPGPIVASAILTNYEEIDLKPIYRDPVHDFGFMQFDPSKVKFMELEEIPLSPERAKVGLDIRVVGWVFFSAHVLLQFNVKSISLEMMLVKSWVFSLVLWQD